MTTLQGQELFEYLHHLQSELDKSMTPLKDSDLEHLMHKEMKKILVGEENLLRYLNSNDTEPVLSFTGNGLPSIESLRPDLEKICELSESKPEFKELSKEYNKGKNIPKVRDSYKSLSEEEYDLKLSELKDNISEKQISFSLYQNDDGKLEFRLTEECYVKGYDKHSKESPVLIRHGKIDYQIAWNRLFSSCIKKFYEPDTNEILSNKEKRIKLNKKFSTIYLDYKMNIKHYDSSKVEKSGFLRKKFKITNYSEFLLSGTNSRIKIFNILLEKLKNEFKDQGIKAKDISSRQELEEILRYSNAPFENSPETMLTKNDVDEIVKNKIIRHKFELIDSNSTELASIYFWIPRVEIPFGNIRLFINGDHISNQEQNDRLMNEFNKIKI